MTIVTTTHARGIDQHSVIGVFDSPEQAERALTHLKGRGFSPEHVSVIARDSAETRALVRDSAMDGTGTGTGVVAGGVAGGIAGGLVGWLVGSSTLVIPGIGPIIGAGVAAATLVGAGVGAAAGGLIGALAELGVPAEDARGYEESVRAGRILIAVTTTSEVQARAAQEIFDHLGGVDVRRYGMLSISARDGTAGHDLDHPGI